MNSSILANQQRSGRTGPDSGSGANWLEEDLMIRRRRIAAAENYGRKGKGREGKGREGKAR